MKKYNPTLRAYASDIVALPRWIESVAIVTQETQVCTVGVGSSKNNCGAIKGRDGKFISYKSPVDSIRAVSNLLNTKYKGKTIPQINGSYCVNEIAGSGKCPNWTENVVNNIDQLIK